MGTVRCQEPSRATGIRQTGCELTGVYYVEGTILAVQGQATYGLNTYWVLFDGTLLPVDSAVAT